MVDGEDQWKGGNGSLGQRSEPEVWVWNVILRT